MYCGVGGGWGGGGWGVFFFNDTATTEIYTLSLHDALPISNQGAETYIRFLSKNITIKLSEVYLPDIRRGQKQMAVINPRRQPALYRKENVSTRLNIIIYFI